MDDLFAGWMAALEARHLADLRVPEVTRALRALSSAYVERRHTISRGSALESAGKRAAFALVYAPLHFLAMRHVVQRLQAEKPTPLTIVDLGCGTGAAGAAWAVQAEGVPRVIGIDRHPWALAEARWTYRQLGVRGDTRQADAARFRPAPAVSTTGGLCIVAAYLLNELPQGSRQALARTLVDAGARGARVLIVEPIARSVTPWWGALADDVVRAGGRNDEWNIALDLPPLVRMFDKAAGLDHRALKARSLYVAGGSRSG
jgi:hypothetical protein